MKVKVISTESGFRGQAEGFEYHQFLADALYEVRKVTMQCSCEVISDLFPGSTYFVYKGTDGWTKTDKIEYDRFSHYDTFPQLCWSILTWLRAHAVRGVCPPLRVLLQQFNDLQEETVFAALQSLYESKYVFFDPCSTETEKQIHLLNTTRN